MLFLHSTPPTAVDITYCSTHILCCLVASWPAQLVTADVEGPQTVEHCTQRCGDAGSGRDLKLPDVITKCMHYSVEKERNILTTPEAYVHVQCMYVAVHGLMGYVPREWPYEYDAHLHL